MSIESLIFTLNYAKIIMYSNYLPSLSRKGLTPFATLACKLSRLKSALIRLKTVCCRPCNKPTFHTVLLNKIIFHVPMPRRGEREREFELEFENFILQGL